MKYNFDQVVERKGTLSFKWDARKAIVDFGMGDRFDDETIPLFVADMDLPCPKPILDALHARVDQQIFGYTAYDATDEYRKAIQGWFKRRHEWDIEADSIVYADGTMDGIGALIRAFSKEGEGVIVQKPVFGPFFNMAEQCNRVVVNNALLNDDGFYTIDFDDFEAKARDPNNTVFILCSPHNPIGRVWSFAELKRMAEICLANNVTLISDEIHGDLMRAGKVHHPICTVVNDDRLVAVTAINKTFNTAALKCANIIIKNSEMRERLKAELGFKSPCPFTIAALVAAYTEGEEWLEQVNEYLDGNFDYMESFLAEHMPEVKFWKSDGSYIGWIDFRGLGLTPAELRQRIFTDANVILQEGHNFGVEGTGFQRICIPVARSVLVEALNRIKNALGR